MEPEYKLVTIAADISDKQSVEKLFSQLMKGKEIAKLPDVLVNHAGSCVSLTSIVDSEPGMTRWRPRERRFLGMIC